MIWQLKQLQKTDTQTNKNGKWVPARPINWKHRTLLERIKEAWSVFIGRAEAFYWPEGQ